MRVTCSTTRGRWLDRHRPTGSTGRVSSPFRRCSRGRSASRSTCPSDANGVPMMNAPTGRLSDRLTLPQPYLLFLGDTTEPSYAKTAFGLVDWAADRCVGEFAAEGCTVPTGLPRLAPAAARAAGPGALVIGVANQGGVIGESWVALLVEAMEAGLDIVSGLHVRLSSLPALAEAARRTGQRLIDVRSPPPDIPVGTGRKRSGKRLLTVGT